MGQGQAFSGGNASAVRWFAEQPEWWESHYEGAVDQILEFLAGDGLSLEGRRVLDLGCGDGIITLGLATRTSAASVIGIDLEPVDTDFLKQMATAHGVSPDQPNLTFGVSGETNLGLPDSSVDVVITWSVFEHVADVVGLLNEVRRVLVTEGLLFLQIWPLFFSAHGSHLWPWFDAPFAHLRLEDGDLRNHVRGRVASTELAEAMLDLYDSCNHITLDELGEALIQAGFYISKVETDAGAIHIPPELQRMKLSLLTTAGVKLNAIKPGLPGDVTL